jgi:CDP-glycerol glycerophosphotransferase
MGMALVLFEKSIKKNSHAESYFKAGMCNLKLQKYDEAFHYIKKSLELAPAKIQWREQFEQCSRHLDKLHDHFISKSSSERIY